MWTSKEAIVNEPEENEATVQIHPGEVPTSSVDDEDPVAGDAVHVAEEDVPQMELPFDDTPAHPSFEAPGERQDEEAEPEAADDPHSSLREFLVTFDPALRGTDFHPVKVAVARLSTQKEYLEQFQIQAGELRTGIEELQVELTQARAEVERAMQKDVRDERIVAIVAILKQKAGDSVMVGRIRKLLE